MPVHSDQGYPPPRQCLVFAQQEMVVPSSRGPGSGAGSEPRSASALQINDETELEALCAEIASQHLATESPDSPNKPCCRFTYLTMTGEEVELCSRGRHIPVA